jgi:hypothetical protein
MIKTDPFQFVSSFCDCLANSTLCLFSCWQVGQDVVQALQQAMNRQHGPKLRVAVLVNKISIS